MDVVFAIPFGGGAPGWPELLIIVLVIMLLFGAKRLPELSRSVGRSISEFKKGRKEGILSEGDDETEAAKEASSSSKEGDKEKADA